MDDLVDFTPEIRAHGARGGQGLPDGSAVHAAVAARARWSRPGTGGRRRTGRARRSIRRPACSTCRRATASRCSRWSSPTPALEQQPALHAGAGRSPQMPQGLPLLKPPYSRMTAIDMNTGEHAWMVPAGDGERIRNHAAAEGPQPAAARRRQHVQRSAADEDAADLRADDRRHATAARGWSRSTRRRARSSRRPICPAPRSARR